MCLGDGLSVGYLGALCANIKGIVILFSIVKGGKVGHFFP